MQESPLKSVHHVFEFKIEIVTKAFVIDQHLHACNMGLLTKPCSFGSTIERHVSKTTRVMKIMAGQDRQLLRLALL